MITIERTYDLELVRRFMTNPRVYECLIDDGCGPASEFRPSDSPAVIYALVIDDGRAAGVFMFVPENTITCQVHTCLDPSMWGRSVEAAKEAAKWIWSNTGFLRINTQVPVSNKLAERLSKLSGMTQYGLCPKAFKRGGKLWDIALYGMSKE